MGSARAERPRRRPPAGRRRSRAAIGGSSWPPDAATTVVVPAECLRQEGCASATLLLLVAHARLARCTLGVLAALTRHQPAVLIRRQRVALGVVLLARVSVFLDLRLLVGHGASSCCWGRSTVAPTPRTGNWQCDNGTVAQATVGVVISRLGGGRRKVR